MGLGRLLPVLAAAALAVACAANPAAGLYILQSNDLDPTTPTSQMDGRWNHWLAVDPAVTHLETAIAVDAGQYRGVGQRIAVPAGAPVVAVQVKLKRIGEPGALLWQAGTTWGAGDLGRGEVPASEVGVHYEHFVTLRVAPATPPVIYLQLAARSGTCPADYYAAYCTWAEQSPDVLDFEGYYGRKKLRMLYRLVRRDPQGEALDPAGKPMPQGPSMMTRVLTTEAAPDRRHIEPFEEEPFTFVEALSRGDDPRREGLPWPGVAAEPGDVHLSSDWRIQVLAPHSPQADVAVADLESFLRDCLRLTLPVLWDPTAPLAARTLVVAQGGEGPEAPREPASYRFEASHDQLRITGADARGVLRGIWYLEDLLMLRGGPFLRPAARTRAPRYTPRLTSAPWGTQGEVATTAPVYTDGLLSLISHYGYDGIFVIWRPGLEPEGDLPNRIAPGHLPKGTSHTPFTPLLRDLIERAARFDIEVVVQYSGGWPEDAAGRQRVREEARRFVRDVPRLKRIVLLDEAMGTSWRSLDAWVDNLKGLVPAFHEGRPDLELIAWVYTFHATAPDAKAVDHLMQRLGSVDRRLSIMYNFDSYWARRRDGTLQPSFDYCLSLEAPSEDYRLLAAWLLAEAQRDGQPPRRLWAKIESRFSQESNTQPEIPCLQRWAERFAAVNDFGPPAICGLWAQYFHQGFFPTPVAELFGWLSYTDAPPGDELLRALARRDFGPGQEERVLAAWASFSEAICHYPFYYGLTYTMNTGLAQPFWLDPAQPNPRPWRRGFVNDLGTMQLADSGTGPGSGPENRARLAELQRHWHAGLQALRQSTEAAPPHVRERAESQWRTAQSFGHKADTTLRLVRWLDARKRLYSPADREAALAAVEALETVGQEELEAVRTALPMYLRDSRLGNLNHGRGCFTAETILWKIGELERTLGQDLPALLEAARSFQPAAGELDRAALEAAWEVRTQGKGAQRWQGQVLVLSSPDAASAVSLASREPLRLPVRISFALGTGVIDEGTTFCLMSKPPSVGPNSAVHEGRQTFLVLKPGYWYYKLVPETIAIQRPWHDSLSLQPGGPLHRFTLEVRQKEVRLAIDGTEVLRGPVDLPEGLFAYLSPDAYTNYSRGTLYLYSLSVEPLKPAP